MKKFVLVAIALLLSGCTSLSGPSVTYDEYLEIEIAEFPGESGSTVKEAEEIIGEPCTVTMDTDTFGMCVWENSDGGGAISVLFENGIAVQKSQEGLSDD